jgi:hypothetical protein
MDNKGKKQAAKGVRQLRLSPMKGVEAKYANVVRISHSPAELVFDFGLILPGEKVAQVVSKVVMSPLGVKLLHKALTDNLAKFEKKFGEINIPKKETLADNLFQTIKPEDEPEVDPEEGKDG